MPLRLAPGVRWIPVEDGVVIYEPGWSRFVDLNVAGGAIWSELLDADFDVQAAVERLSQQYPGAAADIERSGEELVNRLVVLDVLYHS